MIARTTLNNKRREQYRSIGIKVDRRRCRRSKDSGKDSYGLRREKKGGNREKGACA